MQQRPLSLPVSSAVAAESEEAPLALPHERLLPESLPLARGQP